MTTLSPGDALRILFPHKPIGIVSVPRLPDQTDLERLAAWARVNVPGGNNPQTWVRRGRYPREQYKYRGDSAVIRHAVWWLMRNHWEQAGIKMRPSLPEIGDVTQAGHNTVLEGVRRMQAKLAAATTTA